MEVGFNIQRRGKSDSLSLYLMIHNSCMSDQSECWEKSRKFSTQDATKSAC